MRSIHSEHTSDKKISKETSINSSRNNKGDVTEKFISQVNTFIERYRGALKRLAKK